jgi:hypothetical protein
VRKRKAYVDLPSSEGEGVASDHEEDGVKDMRVNAREDAREFGEGQGEGRENWVVNEADGGRDRVDQEEGGSEGVDQEEGDGGAKEDVDVENVEGESDHIEGEANHPTSPAYSSATAKSRLEFMKVLSNEEAYVQAFKAMKKVSLLYECINSVAHVITGWHSGPSRYANVGILEIWRGIPPAILSHSRRVHQRHGYNFDGGDWGQCPVAWITTGLWVGPS